MSDHVQSALQILELLAADMEQGYADQYPSERWKVERVRAARNHLRSAVSPPLDAAEARAETMRQTVEMLNFRGIEAFFEYPGFISVPTEDGRGLAFGDAAGDEYGGNYNDGGGEGFDFALPLSVTAREFADAIEETARRLDLPPAGEEHE